MKISLFDDDLYRCSTALREIEYAENKDLLNESNNKIKKLKELLGLCDSETLKLYKQRFEIAQYTVKELIKCDSDYESITSAYEKVRIYIGVIFWLFILSLITLCFVLTHPTFVLIIDLLVFLIIEVYLVGTQVIITNSRATLASSYNSFLRDLNVVANVNRNYINENYITSCRECEELWGKLKTGDEIAREKCKIQKDIFATELGDAVLEKLNQLNMS